MKSLLIILGVIILLAGISTLAGGLAYATGPKDKDPNHYGLGASNKEIEDGNIKVTKISAVVLGIAILAYVLLNKFGKKL